MDKYYTEIEYEEFSKRQLNIVYEDHLNLEFTKGYSFEYIGYYWIILEKSIDEWYYASIGNSFNRMSGTISTHYRYYKCDQFDGLIKFLDDNIDPPLN